MQSISPNPTSKSHLLAWAVVGAGLALLGLGSLLALPGLRQAPPALNGAPARFDYPAPELKLTDLQDRPVALADFRGSVVIYNAWATWCPPCKEEMPILQAYFDAHAAEGLVVLAIENGEPAPEVADYVRANRLTFPVWPDPRWKAATSFGISSLPTTVVIDRRGNVRLTWLGPVTLEGLERYVNPVIEELE